MILARYVAKTVLAAIVTAVLVMAAMELFILFVGELSYIGQGDYSVKQAFYYVLMQTPYQIYLFFPMACLLGCLVGLGILATNSELIIMRGAGMSILDICWTVLKATAVVIIVVSVLGETVVPRLMHRATDLKAMATSGGQAVKTSQGTWARANNDYLHLATIKTDGTALGVTRYQMDDSGQMVSVSFAQKVSFAAGKWTAHAVETTRFLRDRIVTSAEAEQVWPINLSPELLAGGQVLPEEMTFSQLVNYISALEKNHSPADSYVLAKYKRILQPLAACVMMMLAIPFIFGPLRNATFGYRFLAGAMLGFAFYILNQFFGPVSLVYALPPSVGAFAPIILFAGIGVWMMQKVR